jgi:hypothetical protein
VASTPIVANSCRDDGVDALLGVGAQAALADRFRRRIGSLLG